MYLHKCILELFAGEKYDGQARGDIAPIWPRLMGASAVERVETPRACNWKLDRIFCQQSVQSAPRPLRPIPIRPAKGR